MANVIHFNMIVEINQLLKQHQIDYTIHAVGGCTCSGVQLKRHGNIYPIDKIISLINTYLANQFMIVVPSKEDNTILLVKSKFKSKGEE